MHPVFVEKAIYFPIQAIRGENVKAGLRELKAVEAFGEKEAREYRDRKIVELLHHAYGRVPYFRRLLDDLNLEPGDIRSASDLGRVPFLTKQEVRSRLEDLQVKGLRCSWRSTSGTAGYPLRFPKDRQATAFMDAMMYIAYSWHGIRIGDRQARVWGTGIRKKDRLRNTVRDFLLNRKRLSAFKLAEPDCIDFYKKIERFKPAFMYGYSNAVYEFARTLEANGIDAAKAGMRVVICTGELLLEDRRKEMQDIFGVKVVNEYGTTENGIIGFECRHGGMHVVPTVHLEVADPDEDGYGELVVTELNSRSVPFIRYRIGDRGRIAAGAECECGRPYPIMEISGGRTHDYIRCPDGRKVYATVLAYSLKEFAAQFKAYQKAIDRLDILMIPKGQLTVEVESMIAGKLRGIVGERMNISFTQVSNIPVEPSGKLRYFVCELDS